VESYKVITVTHKTTHISRLKDYLLKEETSTFPYHLLAALKDRLDLKELFYLNTCNRVTFFFVNDQPVDRSFLSSLFHFINPGFDDALLDVHVDSTQVFEGEEAVHHLFQVAASIDSLIIGEREIMRQMKEAYTNCREHGLCGDNIRLVMEQAIVLSKKVCNETRLSEKPVSVVSLAFREFLQIVDNKDVEIVMIGAGQTNNLLANMLEKYGYLNVTVFNRSADKAHMIAHRFTGKSYPLSSIKKVALHPQVIIACTSSHDAIVDESLMKYWGIDPLQPITIIDLGVPVNVDIKVVAKYIVNYIHVAGLEKMAEKNKAFRQKEMGKAEFLINNYMETFRELHLERQVERAMGEIPVKVKALRSRAYDVFRKDIDSLDVTGRETLEKMMDYLEQKYIGMPIKIAKKTLLKKHLTDRS